MIQGHFSFCIWVRLFGRGIWIGSTPELYSTRSGQYIGFRIGNWRFKWLPKVAA